MIYGTISDSLVVSHDDDKALDALRGFPVLKKHGGNTGTKANKGKFLLDCIAAFDTETTAIETKHGPQAFTYVWQLQIEEGLTIIGREWGELFELLQHWSDYMPSGAWLVIWVQNLSYEFQFMSGVYDFRPSEVFAVDSRKVLYCRMFDRFEFRCSYLHSNMSLDAFGKRWHTKHRKLVGELDYSVTRYPWTPLKDDELPYMVNDVVVLVEAIRAEMEAEKVDLYKIPKTSTGWVRTDVKKAMRKVKYGTIRDQQPDYHLYTILREAFRGGNTHANRFYSGETLHNVASVDESSAYPFVLCVCKFPSGPFVPVRNPTTSDLDLVIDIRKKAVLMRVAFYDIDLADVWQGCPYLTVDKSRNIRGAVVDNGRIMKADYLETSLTDVDYQIIRKMYTWSQMDVHEMYKSRYATLPAVLRQEIQKYYSMKTGLKGVEGMETYYNKSKARLNSIYGMMAQNPVKQMIRYKGGEFVEDEKDEADILENYVRRAFTCYQWGVWTTAWSRWFLQQGIDACGRDFVYTDTDSVKYRHGDPAIEQRIAELNEERKALAIKYAAWANDPTGTPHYMGVFESEGVYQEFKTLGAKKYVYRRPGGNLLCTIAGVSKKAPLDEKGQPIKGRSIAGDELQAAGGIEAFREGFTFVKAGGTESIYNDLEEPLYLRIDSHELAITSNVVIAPSTYTLGITEEYRRIIEGAADLLKIMHKHGIL